MNKNSKMAECYSIFDSRSSNSTSIHHFLTQLLFNVCARGLKIASAMNLESGPDSLEFASDQEPRKDLKNTFAKSTG